MVTTYTIARDILHFSNFIVWPILVGAVIYGIRGILTDVKFYDAMRGGKTKKRMR